MTTDGNFDFILSGSFVTPIKKLGFGRSVPISLGTHKVSNT